MLNICCAGVRQVVSMLYTSSSDLVGCRLFRDPRRISAS